MTIRAGIKHFTAAVLITFTIMIPALALCDQPVPFTSNNWEGVEYCRNGNNGAWFPNVVNPDSACATFATNDICWGMLRTTFTIGRGSGVSLQATPVLSSGGFNIDEAHIGFGDGYSHYQGQFAGLAFSGGRIYLGTSVNYQQQEIGAYTPGQTLAITLFVGPAGILTVSGPGFNGILDTNGVLPDAFHILLDVTDSSDGITYCGPVGTAGPVVPVGLSSWGTLKSDYR
jgi:hypothetical protein